MKLWKKTELKNVNNRDPRFELNTKLFLSENSTLLNQKLAWMCRELKRSAKIQLLEPKGIVKLRRTMNELIMSKINTTQIRDMYPDFIFQEKSSRNWYLLAKWFSLAIYFRNAWVEFTYRICLCRIWKLNLCLYISFVVTFIRMKMIFDPLITFWLFLKSDTTWENFQIRSWLPLFI